LLNRFEKNKEFHTLSSDIFKKKNVNCSSPFLGVRSAMVTPAQVDSYEVIFGVLS